MIEQITQKQYSKATKDSIFKAFYPGIYFQAANKRYYRTKDAASPTTVKEVHEFKKSVKKAMKEQINLFTQDDVLQS